MKARVPAPGSSGACPASAIRNSRPAFSSWATLPQVYERRCEPSVDGARMPPNSEVIAPCRSRSMSSIESAPAAIPATRHGTFSCALTPHSPPGRTCSATRSASPARCASAITGTRPGVRHQIRVIERCVRPGQAMQQSHLTGALSNSATEASDTPIVPVQRAPFTLTRPETPLIDRWIEA